MRSIKKYFILSLILIFSTMISNGQINVTNTNNATVLAQKLVGEGVAISNSTIQCEQNQSGLFVTVASNLGQDSGIVLTTGLAASTLNWGVNGAEINLANFNQGNLGDAALTALAGTNTYDRCILEFDFKANGDSIFFKYTFGSEEYPQFNCTAYNDVFGFFITGPGYPTATNIAFVPGTSIPVAINSINNGVIYPGGSLPNCTSMGAGSPFTSLYINNTAGSTVTYSGFTQLLTAKAVIQPCSTYHLKLAIADGFDHILDSGVFLKAGSLTSNTYKLKVSTDSIGAQFPYVFEGCDTAIIKIKRKLYQTNVNADTVNLVISGTAISGVDFPALQTTHYFSNSIADTEKVLYLLPINDLIAEGTEFVKIVINDGCNIPLDSIRIDIKDPPKFTLFNNDTTICLGKSVSINGVHDNGLSFSWSPTSGVSNPSIFNPIITPTVTTSYTLTASYGSCPPKKDTLNITVQPLPTISLTPTNVTCNGANNGIVVASGTAITLPITFSINPPGTILSGSPATFNNLAAGAYTVTVTSGLGCTNTSPITILQPSPITWGSVTASVIACNGGNIGTISSSASGGTGGISYTLLPNNITNTTGAFNSLAAGTYTVSAKDANNCSVNTTIIITQTLGLNWGSVVHTNVLCNGQANGTISALVTGGTGIINYTLNPGAVTNTSGNFNNLGPNTYTISAIDANGCTAISTVIITQNAQVSVANATSTNVLCFGANTGTIQITLSGGAGPYQYTLLPGNISSVNGQFTGLLAGTYTVNVVDVNGCPASTTINITQPPSIIISSFNIVTPTCIPGNNGSIQVVASGGVPSLLYKLNNGSWYASNSFNSLTSGIYVISVLDANGCTISSIMNLTTPNIPVLVNNTLPLTCGTSLAIINVTASNGIAPYTYTLLPNNVSNSTGQFPNVSPGTYTVTVAGANGCTSSLIITIVQPPFLNWQSLIKTQIPCTGGNTGGINAIVNGGVGPYTYVLNPGNSSNQTGLFSNLAANQYTITATDVNGCTTTSLVNIFILPSVTFSSVTHNNITCNGLSNGTINVIASGASSPITYTRNPGAVSNTTGVFTSLAAGSYTITASDGGNCPATTIVSVTQPTLISINSINSTTPTCIPGGDGSITVAASGGTAPFSYSINNGPLQGNTTFLNLSIATYTIKVTDANGCTKTSIFNLSNPTAPSFTSLTSNQINCSGSPTGTVTAVVTGGAGQINFNINPLGLSNTTGIFNNLPVNIYTITAIDANGCAITSTISINQPSQIIWNSVTSTNVTCNNANNGQLNAIASGGVASYTYTLMPGNTSNTTGIFPSLAPNNYTVTVADANGCTITSTISISQPPPLIWLNVAKTNACNNVLGTISVTANGGSPLYNYNLMPGNVTNNTGLFTSLAANVYTINCSDANGCTITSSFTISQSPLIVISSLTNTIPSCNPGNNATITVVANGGASPLLYNLNGGANQVASVFNGIGVSVYTVNVIDAIGCTMSSTVNVANPSSPSISNVTSTSIQCYANTNATMTVTANGGIGALGYLLSPGAVNNSTGIFNNIGANNYTITVTDANNCSATSNFILTQPPILVWDSIDNRDVSCFGGSNGLVTSSASGGTGVITYTLTPPGISNISGAFFGLSIGSYTLTATDLNGCIVSSTFLINQAPPITWASVVSNSPSCIGNTNGSISVTAAGGNGGFEYQINPGGTINTTGVFSNLIVGSYTITAKDAKSCTYTTIVNIVPPPAVQLANVVTTFASCNPGCDGTAVLTGAGGNNVFTYSVNGGVFQGSPNYSLLCSSVYTVTVKDGNNCTGTGTFAITTANGPTALNTAITPVTCNGLSNGQITSTVVGGSGTINYLINPINTSNTTGIFNGLAAGTFTITATDANGCTISSIATMTQPFPVLFTGTNVTNVSCFGGNNGLISTTAIGGNGIFTYTLNPTAQSNTTGIFGTLVSSIYTISVIDGNGCSNSISVTLSTPTEIIPSVPVTTNVSCNGGSNGTAQTTFTGGTGSIGYNLLPGNINNTTGSFSNLSFGTYTITGTDINGCTKTITFNITQPTPLIISAATPTVPSCIPGGDATITVTASGGTVNYLYSINGGGAQNNNLFTNIGNAGIYTINVIDALGCSITSAVNVSTPPGPIVNSINTTQATCNPGCDGTITLAASGGTGIISYSINAAPYQASNVFNGLCSNTYTVTIKDVLGCTLSSVTTITTTPSPVLNSTSFTNVFCNNGNNGSITLGYSGGTNPINFVLQPGNISNTSGLFIGLGANTYTIVGTDANGCTLSTSVVIAQPQTLNFNPPVTTPPSCFGGSNGTITVSTFGGAGSIIYTISPIMGGFNNPGTFTGLLGNATYTITATDLNGCSATTVASISSPTQVVVNTMTSSPITCFGASNGAIIANASGGVGTINYTLQPGAINNQTGIFNGLNGITYTVIASDANGCSANSSIAVFQPPAISISNSNSTNIICFGQINGTVSVSANGGTAPLNYTLQPSNQQNSTGSFTGLSANIYTITITDANGCTLTTTLTVIEPTFVQITNTASTNILCYGQSNGTINVTAQGGVGIMSYTLLPGNILNTNGAFNGLPINTYTILSADANGCSTSTNVTLTQPNALIASLDSTQDVTCHGGNNGLISVSAVGGTFPYFYTMNPGSINSSSGVYSSLFAGSYAIIVTDMKGCMDSVIAISVNEPTQILFDLVTHQDIECYFDSSGSIQAIASGGTGLLTYQIIPSIGTQTSPGVFDNLSGGTYTIVVTDANGCTTTSSVLIKQNLQIVASNVTLVQPICHGESNGSINIVAQGGIPPMSYSLDGGQFTQNGLFLNQSAGSHTVIVMDSKGCSYDTVLVLTEPDLISADVKIDGIFCSDQSDAKIKITGKGGRSNYTYYLKPGFFVNKTGAFEGLSPGTYTLTITDSARCQFDTIIVVELPTNPLLTTFTHGDIGCYGTGNEGWAQVYVTGGTTPYSYMWNTSPVQTDEKATELRFGWHGVLVTDANGCTKKDSVYIDPGPCCDEVFIPNAFSPNNDGKNDLWRVVTAAGIELQQLAVYDRWGNRIWSATDIFQGWDGTYKGKLEDMNTFYYIFRYRCLNDGQDYLKKGDLILMR